MRRRTQFSSLALIPCREIARIALEALLRDGRIHPSSIEDEVVKAEEEMHANIIDLGEGALRKLRLHDVHPEVVALLGKLHYRLSNNQNTLAHSVEVANLCALIASEIGLDPTIAKRAGLFHDLGKAADEEYEDSHAVVGAKIIKQHGEDARGQCRRCAPSRSTSGECLCRTCNGR